MIFGGTSTLGLFAVVDGKKDNGLPVGVVYDHNLEVGTLVVWSVNCNVDSPQTSELLIVNLTFGLLYNEILVVVSAVHPLIEVAVNLTAYTVSKFPALSPNWSWYRLLTLVGNALKYEGVLDVKLVTDHAAL